MNPDPGWSLSLQNSLSLKSTNKTSTCAENFILGNIGVKQCYIAYIIAPKKSFPMHLHVIDHALKFLDLYPTKFQLLMVTTQILSSIGISLKEISDKTMESADLDQTTFMSSLILLYFLYKINPWLQMTTNISERSTAMWYPLALITHLDTTQFICTTHQHVTFKDEAIS